MTCDPLNVLASFKDQRIVVLGDLMVDTYLRGESTRLCPEAPVPVIDLTRESSYAGGAANSAVNFRKLGCEVTFCSVCGNDAAASKAKKILEEAGITCALLTDNDRSTIEKTRVLSGSHMLARVDTGTVQALSSASEMALCTILEAALESATALLIADYGKGILTPNLLKCIAEVKRRRASSSSHSGGLFIAVDSKNLELYRPLAPDLVKPNYKEAVSLLGLEPDYSNRVSTLAAYGKKLCTTTGAGHIALTLDEDGVLLFGTAGKVNHISTPPVQKAFVSGGGDTFLAAATLSTISGASMNDAAEMGCAAASVAIAREETSFCSNDELCTFYSQHQKAVTDLRELAKLCDFYHRTGKTLVFTNGCFDILHSGHVAYLAQAKALGHILIVGLNTDSSIGRLKGPSRPINQLEDRTKVLSALASVDHVVPFGSPGDDTPASLIALVRPHIFVKGGDYRLTDLPEAGIVKKFGGMIQILPFLSGHSTTATIRKIFIGDQVSPTLQNAR